MFSNLMIVWAYLTLCVILGFFKIPKIKSLKDYTIGSTQFSTAILTFSMIATLIGPADTIGKAEKSYSIGIIFVVTTIFDCLHWILMGYLLAPAVGYLRMNNCTTLVDIMRFYYGKWGRYVCVATLAISIALLAVFYKSAAFILERFLNIPFVHGAALITLAVSIYSIFGGIHAIVITDVIQFFIFITIIPAVFFVGISNIDVSATLANIPHEKMSVSAKDIPLIISFVIYGLIPITGFPFIQRGLMAENPKQVKNIFNFTGIFTSIFFVMMGMIGLLSAGMNPEIQSDNALFYFIDNTVPPAIMGFIAVSILAVIMSTASAFLNAVTVVIIKDILVPLYPNLGDDAKQVKLTKFAGLIVAVASFCMIFMKDHIMDILWMLDNFWDPFISIPLMLGLVGVRIKARHFKYVICAGLAGVLGARMLHDGFDTITLASGVVTSAVATFWFRDKNIGKMDRAHDDDEIIDDPKLEKAA